MLLREILKKLPDERTPEEDEVLRSLARSACKKVIMKADAISTTTTSSMNAWTCKFVKSRSTTTIIDEACACVPAEANIAYRGDVRKRKLIMAGDWKQLIPAVLSFMEKYLNTQQWVNRFGDNQRNSFMRRLIERGWPVFVLSEQLRMVPRGGDSPMTLSMTAR